MGVTVIINVVDSLCVIRAIIIVDFNVSAVLITVIDFAKLS